MPEADGEFTAFCAAEYPRIAAALSLWCGDRAVAEEVASEAFARAYRDWKRIRRMESPGGWVRRVAINLATSRFRRRQARRRAEQRVAHDTPTTTHDPDSAAVVAVRAALQELSPAHRTVLVLRYHLDMPISEVAAVMDRSETSVTSLTQRAAAALRAQLERNEDRVGEGSRHG